MGPRGSQDHPRPPTLKKKGLVYGDGDLDHNPYHLIDGPQVYTIQNKCNVDPMVQRIRMGAKSWDLSLSRQVPVGGPLTMDLKICLGHSLLQKISPIRPF